MNILQHTYLTAWWRHNLCYIPRHVNLHVKIKYIHFEEKNSKKTRENVKDFLPEDSKQNFMTNWKIRS